MSKLESLLKLAALIGDEQVSTTADPFVGKQVLVRSRNAGVIVGLCTAIDGQSVTLQQARQVWSWKAKQGGTCIDLASHGVKEAKLSYASECDVRVTEACAVYVLTGPATQSFAGISSEGQWK